MKKENVISMLCSVLGVIIGSKTTDLLESFVGSFTLYFSGAAAIGVLCYTLSGWWNWKELIDCIARFVLGVLFLGTYVAAAFMCTLMGLGVLLTAIIVPVAGGVLTLLWVLTSAKITYYINNKTEWQK